MEIDVREGIGKIQKLALQIEIILISWDIEDADGERVKPTYDVLSKLDYQVINALFKGIIDDMLPPKAPVALSVAGS